LLRAVVCVRKVGVSAGSLLQHLLDEFPPAACVIEYSLGLEFSLNRFEGLEVQAQHDADETGYPNYVKKGGQEDLPDELTRELIGNTAVDLE